MRALLLGALGLGASLAMPAVTVSPAHAQSKAVKQRALDAYQKGTTQYNLGKWTEAIRYFELAFETYPDPAFLFNIAQSHRQAGNCKEAIFFYSRYQALKPDATNKDEVTAFIAELQAQCENKPADKPDVPTPDPEPNPDPDPSPDPNLNPAVGPIGTPKEDVNSAALTSPADKSGGLLNVRASFGSSLLFAGSELDTPPQLSLSLGAGYPIDLGSLLLDAGVLFSYSPIPWETENASGTTSFTGILANVGATKEVASKISARGEFGAGLMLVSGLGDEQNVFAGEDMTDDLGVSASLRVALGAEFALSDTLSLSAHPVIFTVSQAPSGMRDSIGSVSTYQALVGLGLKL